MPKIAGHMTELLEEVRNGEIIHFDQQGNWEIMHPLKRGFLKFLGVKEFYQRKMRKIFAAEVETWNKVPEGAEYQALMEILSMFGLERTKVAFQYRTKHLLQDSEEHYVALRKLATEWKANQELQESRLSLVDLQRLQTVSQYNSFAALVLMDADLREELFMWVLRDRIDPQVFIEFPGLAKKLIAAHLNGRIGRHGGKQLKIKIEENRKIVTLPFEGRDINILDDELMVSFKRDYRLTIGEIFEVFRRKDVDVGNLEYMAEGIVNWNIHHLGPWNALTKTWEKVDITQDSWWEQMPVFEILSREEASERYGWNMDGIKWNASAVATRGSATLDYEQTHAFMEVAVPLKGKYAIFDFGKLSLFYPGNFLEILQIFAKNMHATVAYPDENIFFSHRQHGRHSIPLTPEQGRAIMDELKADIITSREGHFIYQIESENCAKWVFQKLEAVIGRDVLPNLFIMPLLNTEPQGGMSHFFDIIRKLPEKFQVFVLTRSHHILGAARGTWVQENGIWMRKSLTDHAFWETGIVYLPALLVHQLNEGILHVATHLIRNVASLKPFDYARQIYEALLSKLLLKNISIVWYNRECEGSTTNLPKIAYEL